MAAMTYYVALAFKLSEEGGDIVACDPKEARSSDQVIRVAGSRRRLSSVFGGRRWFFVCPRTGANAAKLHLPSGADTFACRKAYRLGYDPSANRRVIAHRPEPSPYVAKLAARGESATTSQSRKECTGARSNAPWREWTRRRRSRRRTSLLGSIGLRGDRPEREIQALARMARDTMAAIE
jgi:hypothetical protein